MTNLRFALTKLAHLNPDGIRQHLVPLLRVDTNDRVAAGNQKIPAVVTKTYTAVEKYLTTKYPSMSFRADSELNYARYSRDSPHSLVWALQSGPRQVVEITVYFPVFSHDTKGWKYTIKIAGGYMSDSANRMVYEVSTLPTAKEIIKSVLSRSKSWMPKDNPTKEDIVKFVRDQDRDIEYELGSDGHTLKFSLPSDDVFESSDYDHETDDNGETDESTYNRLRDTHGPWDENGSIMRKVEKNLLAEFKTAIVKTELYYTELTVTLKA